MVRRTHRRELRDLESLRPLVAPSLCLDTTSNLRLSKSRSSLNLASNLYIKGVNISIKMLKDVGMTVPKSRETSAVYMQQDRG